MATQGQRVAQTEDERPATLLGGQHTTNLPHGQPTLWKPDFQTAWGCPLTPSPEWADDLEPSENQANFMEAIGFKKY